MQSSGIFMTGLPTFALEHQQRVVEQLERIVPPDGANDRSVTAAMRYTLLAPSKRVRATLTLLSADLCGGSTHALPAAAAVELVHAASLILDDLPCMDDAPLRRGRPANHVQFGESTAILAAFGLLNLAYSEIASAYEPPLAKALTALIAEAVGMTGLIAGQAEDLAAARGTAGFEALERIHRLKTGMLFGAAATAGALTAQASRDQVAALSAYAKNLGLAFQIIDDLLDVEGDPAETGKAVRADARKTTFVYFSGVEGARQLAGELCETANAALAPFGRRADRLRELSGFVAARRL